MTPNRDPSHICVVGSSNIDLTFRTERLPKLGETLTGRAFHLGYGGKGANQAVMAARLGAQVTMISKVGRDVFGEGTLRNYREHGIDTKFVFTDAEQPSGVAGIVVDDAAQNCIIVAPGANGRLTPEDVREAAAAIQSADMLLCQLEVPLDTTRKALEIARAAEVRSILNPAPALPLSDDLLRLADLIVPNETELELLCTDPPGLTRRLGEMDDIEAAARQLRRRGVGTVIVTLGARGTLVVGDPSAKHVPAVPVQAIDPTGAGDAFIGSLAVFLAEGIPLLDAVRKANAVAALTVTRIGTQTSFPTRAEVDAALNR